VRRQRRPGRIIVGIAALLTGLCACATGGNVAIHGRVLKSVGRPCNLLSAAFPDVAHRTISFVDQTDAEIGRAVTGSQHVQDDDRGGCLLSSTYRVTLPLRASYGANVSSLVAQIPTSPAIGVDALAAKRWRFDVRIPATA
jgi:hypothetical protein